MPSDRLRQLAEECRQSRVRGDFVSRSISSQGDIRDDFRPVRFPAWDGLRRGQQSEAGRIDLVDVAGGRRIFVDVRLVIVSVEASAALGHLSISVAIRHRLLINDDDVQPRVQTSILCLLSGMSGILSFRRSQESNAATIDSWAASLA